MKYLSLFSGIGGFELGIQQAYEICNANRSKNRGSEENSQGDKGQGLQSETREETSTSQRPVSERSNNITDERPLCTNNPRIKQAYENMDNRGTASPSELAVHGNKSDTNSSDGNGRRTDPVCIGFSEIDKYATQIYQKHFPNHKNYGDITKINEKELPDFDFLVGGVPCQSWSIAGKRGGFADERGNMWFQCTKILRAKQPKFFVFENVKGLLSHDGGNSMERICEELCSCGYAIDFEVLNSKNHGVPQNRERVIIVGMRLDLLDECQLF